MASQKTKFTVGLFMLGGVVIALAGILWVGMSSLFQKGERYVTYFNESVQGLDVDSPVKYRGVSVGRVERISVAPDSKLIEVVLKIEDRQKLEEGIVAQLKNVGITGLMFVELDQRKIGEPVQTLKLSFPAKYKVIPSKPSDISELLKGIDEVIKQVKNFDLPGVSERLKKTLDAAAKTVEGVNEAVAQADVKAISEGVQAALKDLRQVIEPNRWQRIIVSVDDLIQNTDNAVTSAGRTVNRIDGIVVEKRAAVLAAVDEFGKAMENANIFLEKGTAVVDTTGASIGELRRYLVFTAQNLERASENLTRITETLADKPSELIFGGAPPRREVEVDY